MSAIFKLIIVRFPFGQTLGDSHFNSSFFNDSISSSLNFLSSAIERD